MDRAGSQINRFLQGNYTCVVESEAGNDTRTTEVTIIGT